jgi:hypothetical protein
MEGVSVALLVASRIIVDRPGVFAQTFSIPEPAIDELGHVSNLKYIAWMHNTYALRQFTEGRPKGSFPKGHPIHNPLT